MDPQENTLLPKTSFERWMIVTTVMLVAIIEVLDMTIVNVALAPMMGSLGATTEQITWILTSYIVSSAIFMVMTGFFVTRFGRKRLLLVNIIGFLFTSALCGIATSLPEIVFFRTLQGIFGASLVPLSQIILRSSYPKSEYGKAMSIWGIGIMVAPVLGPTLGGYITDNLTWRWVFYINIPVCIIALLMAIKFVKESVTVKYPIDWLGMILIVTGVGSLQIFLDRGNSSGWFDSHLMTFLFFLCLSSLSLLVYCGLRRKHNVTNLRLFNDRNFAIACTLMIAYTVSILGIISIEPLLLEKILGFPTITTGIIMAPMGVSSAIGMIIVGRIIARIDPRKIMFIGVSFSAIGIYLMSNYNLEATPGNWMIAGAIQGFGMGLFFVPLATIAFVTLKAQEIPDASGLFSFSRNIGASIGISILSTVLTRECQINWNRLGGHIHQYNPNLHDWLNLHHWTMHDPTALSILSQQLMLQANMVAFVDCFRLITLILVAILPILFLMKRPGISGQQEKEAGPVHV